MEECSPRTFALSLWASRRRMGVLRLENPSHPPGWEPNEREVQGPLDWESSPWTFPLHACPWGRVGRQPRLLCSYHGHTSDPRDTEARGGGPLTQGRAWDHEQREQRDTAWGWERAGAELSTQVLLLNVAVPLLPSWRGGGGERGNQIAPFMRELSEGMLTIPPQIPFVVSRKNMLF